MAPTAFAVGCFV